MQEISVNPYTSERWSDIRVKFELVDTDAAEDATPAATSEATISNLAQVHNRNDKMTKKMATLEKDYFLLDGSFELPDESDNGEIGWWSGEISDENRILITPQVLEFNFTKDHSSVGFTIFFDNKANEYASDFTIKVYDSMGILMDEDIVTDNNSNVYVSDMPVDRYRKVVITFTKTSKPYRRIRVCEVLFGIVEIFDKDNTTKMNLLYEVSLNAESFSSHELDITIDNSDKKYNMINPDGIYKYLQQGQELSAEMGVGEERSVEKVNMGKFFYSYSQAEDDSITARITAHDLSFTLVSSRCRLGETGTWTVSEAVTAVIADSGLNITAIIPSNIGNRIINKCIPYNLSHREAFRMIAQAAMCTCYFNRDDELVFAELSVSETAVDILDNDNMSVPAKVKDTGRINRIELIVNDQYAETETIYTASNIETGENERVKTFENPLAHDGQNVVNWLLAIEQMRIKYELQERGNPAREIADIVKIYDAYNENRNAIITREEYMYDGTLTANTEARGNAL